MWMMKAAMENGIPTLLQTHLRLLDSVPVFVLSPVSGAALAFRLDAISVRVLLEFSPGLAVSAAAMRAHS